MSDFLPVALALIAGGVICAFVGHPMLDVPNVRAVSEAVSGGNESGNEKIPENPSDISERK